ncbi:decarboxylase [Salipiger aestuarii]|uniref:Malonyl-CoA decarboxylase n=1 Tax=Salipiger aestuarii TaxID=568098 RepID=A0A327XL12_9RHOB|nr:malonyl-CoA decarboxylase [Salipiger aestuarii]EIE52090.1 malonyl-CoA decarboxylase [Citreicella sp. 357]KAA8605268.1 decarboxylase [Salipiger aestuarii]KAA8607448.1 decarboxylase [Salipiger aestuarii]KAB2537420.1 decarboxylase [Salipiger aestuarii]RAK09423.1 malonyl-CoA decarboxylase [Salipiger aestuarii]
MSLLADLLSTVFERRARIGPILRRDPRSTQALVADLLVATSETAQLWLARRILQRFAEMDDAAKLDFFHHLATAHTLDTRTLRAALDAFESDPTGATYRGITSACEPPRLELMRRLNAVPGATERLVRMRADLLRLGGRDPVLGQLDVDMRHLLRSWFNRGFLVLRPISWESPAHILEKIIAYEAVHAIHSWSDLRRRLKPEDRRCFAFFHPAMPDEPLIFVEVALTRGIPGSIQALLAEDRAPLPPEDADTAVFYSISNCQPGLAGISFGNSLIKQVVGDIHAALPGLKTFVTLSPIPGLLRWLGAQDLPWDADDDKAMTTLAAHYLLNAKRGDGQPVDSVARFHLGNGARVQAVHAGADLSENGMAQSAGVMVNYLYDLSKVERYHEAYAETHEVKAAQAVRSLAGARKTVLAPVG